MHNKRRDNGKATLAIAFGVGMIVAFFCPSGFIVVLLCLVLIFLALLCCK